MYTNYYSSSDAQIYFFNQAGDKSIKIDTTIGLAYTLKQTSTPIYDISNRVPRFFSIGNTVGQGMLLLAFTDEEYIKACIDYINNTFVTGTTSTVITGGEETKNNGTLPTINVTAGTGYTSKKIGYGKISNTAFKDRALQTPSLSVNEQILSIGSINQLFDIKIYINNETLMRASDTKIITLRGVKIVEDSFEVNSNSDSYFTNSYKFIFKDIERR